MDKNMFPNREFDWTNKLKEGKFKDIKDQYLNVFNMKGTPNNKKPVKLSSRIKDLKMSKKFMCNF